MPPEEIKKVIDMFKNGLSRRKIAMLTGRAVKTITAAVKI